MRVTGGTPKRSNPGRVPRAPRGFNRRRRWRREGGPSRVLNSLDERASERISNRGAVPKPSTPEEFDVFVHAEVAKVGKVIREGKIRVE